MQQPHGQDVSASPTTPRLDRVRRWSALIIALATAALYLGSYVIDGLEVCRDQLATVGSDPVVSVCGPATPADGTTAWIVVAILLFPDLSEISTPLWSMKRRRPDADGRGEVASPGCGKEWSDDEL